jgi:hypothetical protein
VWYADNRLWALRFNFVRMPSRLLRPRLAGLARRPVCGRQATACSSLVGAAAAVYQKKNPQGVGKPVFTVVVRREYWSAIANAEKSPSAIGIALSAGAGDLSTTLCLGCVRSGAQP